MIHFYRIFLTIAQGTIILLLIKNTYYLQILTYFYISGRKPDEAPSNITRIEIWSQIEGYEQEKVILDSSADIDDLKERMLREKDVKRSYRAYYKKQQLNSGDQVPLDTTCDQPVVLKKIDSIQSTKIDGKLMHHIHNAINYCSFYRCDTTTEWHSYK
jgi:hypothetical protein